MREFAGTVVLVFGQVTLGVESGELLAVMVVEDADVSVVGGVHGDLDVVRDRA